MTPKRIAAGIASKSWKMRPKSPEKPPKRKVEGTSTSSKEVPTIGRKECPRTCPILVMRNKIQQVSGSKCGKSKGHLFQQCSASPNKECRCRFHMISMGLRPVVAKGSAGKLLRNMETTTVKEKKPRGEAKCVIKTIEKRASLERTTKAKVKDKDPERVREEKSRVSRRSNVFLRSVMRSPEGRTRTAKLKSKHQRRKFRKSRTKEKSRLILKSPVRRTVKLERKEKTKDASEGEGKLEFERCGKKCQKHCRARCWRSTPHVEDCRCPPHVEEEGWVLELARREGVGEETWFKKTKGDEDSSRSQEQE